MVISCSVVGCTNRQGHKPNVSFYLILADKDRRRRWLAEIKRKDWEPSKYSRICSEHFVQAGKSPMMQLEAQLRLCQSCFWCCKNGLRLLSQSHSHRKAVNYYDLLGVKSDASLDEIKNAFFDKSKKLHPDSDPSNPALHSQFVELNEAYRVLSKDPSRKAYDFKIQHPYTGNQVFRSTSRHSTYQSSQESQDNKRYWDQFRQSQSQSQSQEMTQEEQQRRSRRNLRLVVYCVVAMVLSIGAHSIFFRKLEEVHNNFMDEKDRTITEIYNEAKERARLNGFRKQQEILRQKHAEFLEKYKIRNGGEDK